MTTIPISDRQPADRKPEAPAPKFGLGLPFGLLMLVLPPLVYYMWICMRSFGGNMAIPKSSAELRHLISLVPGPSLKAVALYGGWFLLQVVLELVAPGAIKEGTPLADGSRLKYKMNGWFSFWTTMLLVFGLTYFGLLPATLLYDEFGHLLTVVQIFSVVLSIYLFLFPTLYGTGEKGSGLLFKDFFLGRSLNPRLGSFDWKLFCEARPGLILWLLIDLSMAAKQHQLQSAVSTPMILICLFHFLYIADYYYHEEAILTTWDIRHERFGWMLCWGDLVWVPFTYTLQAQYLVNHPHDLSPLAVAGIVALNLLGYFIFRSVNLQKHRFRSNPERPIWGKKPEFITTNRGTLLLASGFWGIGRHLNYSGDLLMGLAWCLLCGFGNLLPYFYIIYFTILLLHRERRDDATCAARYGDSWQEYRKRVPWRMIPGIY